MIWWETMMDQRAINYQHCEHCIVNNCRHTHLRPCAVKDCVAGQREINYE